MKNGSDVTRDRIVEASVHLFSTQGFKGTSTREIARLADINETSLFRHFPRKEDLFWAALNSQLDRLRLRKELQSGLKEIKHPRIVVPLIAEFLVDAARYHSSALKLLIISLIELQPSGELVWRERIGPIIRDIAVYLERCASAGSLKQLDTSVTAVGFFSTVLAHQCMYRVVTGAPNSYANVAEAIEAYSKYLLDTLLPSEGGPDAALYSAPSTL